MMEATPVLQSHPADACHATKEELLNKKKNPLDIDDFCPICLSFNVKCHVANHPAAGYLILLLLYLILNFVLYKYL